MSLLLQDMQEPCLSNVKKVHFETLLLQSQECISIGMYKPNSAPEAILREPKNKSNILKGAIRCPTSINPRYVLHLFSFRHNRWIHTCKNSGNFNETFFRALSTLKKLIRQVYCLINECNNTSAAIHDPRDNGTSHITKTLVHHRHPSYRERCFNSSPLLLNQEIRPNIFRIQMAGAKFTLHHMQRSNNPRRALLLFLMRESPKQRFTNKEAHTTGLLFYEPI